MNERHVLGKCRAWAVVAMSLATALLTTSAMATDVFGGGATFSAGAYVGFQPGSAPLASNTTSGQVGGPIDVNSIFGVWSATSGNRASYCQTDSVIGKSVFNHYDGTAAVPGAAASCLGMVGTSGFGAPSSVFVDPHFASSDLPLSVQDLNNFALGGKQVQYTQPVQFPVLVGSIAIAFNNPNVGSLNLTEQQLCNIFNGTTTNWAQLGFPSRPISVVYRTDYNGTTFSLANHLAKCSPIGASHFVVDPVFTTAVSLFLPTLSASWIGASGNFTARSAIAGNVGAIGYVEAAELKASALTSVRAATVAGFDPYTGLPSSIVLPTVSGRVITTGTMTAAAVVPASTCIVFVDPGSYATSTARYPIVSVSYLVANYTGNGADVLAVRGLLSAPFTSSAAVTTVGTGTGYAFLKPAPPAAPKINACVNI